MSKILRYHQFNESLYDITNDVIGTIVRFDIGLIIGSYLGNIISRITKYMDDKKSYKAIFDKDAPATDKENLTTRKWKFQESNESIDLIYDSDNIGGRYNVKITLKKSNHSISYIFTTGEKKRTPLLEFKLGRNKFNKLVDRIKDLRDISQEMEDFCTDVEDSGFRTEIKYSLNGTISILIKNDKIFLYESLYDKVNELVNRISSYFDTIRFKDTQVTSVASQVDAVIGINPEALMSVNINFELKNI